MYSMVREARPELSREQARAMAETCARGRPAAPAAPMGLPPPFTPPPLLPMAAPGPMDLSPPVPMGPPGQFCMEPDRPGFIPDNQHGYRGGRGHFKRCEGEDGVQSGSHRVEVVVEPSVVPPLVLTEPRVASLAAVPVEPVPAPPDTVGSRTWSCPDRTYTCCRSNRTSVEPSTSSIA